MVLFPEQALFQIESLSIARLRQASLASITTIFGKVKWGVQK